jgi:hypothetical protein
VTGPETRDHGYVTSRVPAWIEGERFGTLRRDEDLAVPESLDLVTRITVRYTKGRPHDGHELTPRGTR